MYKIRILIIFIPICKCTSDKITMKDSTKNSQINKGDKVEIFLKHFI